MVIPRKTSEHFSSHSFTIFYYTKEENIGVKGKLTASIEVKCEGHLIHDLFHSNPHRVPKICPSKVNHFEIYQGGITKVGSIISWKYKPDRKEKIAKIVIEAVDHKKKSITWKVIEGDLLELYNSFTVITSCEHQWITWAFAYEKKTAVTPDPLAFLGFFIELTKDIDGHFLKK
ncbi:kirola-like [Lycium barbarum]|uniref:kirola-like n=1 Tax=Lycium barbarum TaxID=112863 RepID=UPI00293F21FD|nr:kirola-like [Lycium barbarum]